jgi:3-methyladenine DNA glycosylase AlkD
MFNVAALVARPVFVSRMPPARTTNTPARDVAKLLRELRAAGTEQKRASAARVGIPMENAYGVSVATIRLFAKRLRGRPELAQPLWDTAVHEARVLATMLADPQATRRTDIERWFRDVVSWDLCDHLCGNLIRHRDDAPSLVRRWIVSPKLYVRRAAFALIAELAVHGKALDDDVLVDFIQLVVEHAGDPRPHARQAASWALRGIGKRDAANHDRALQAAAGLVASDDTAKRWVGRDAMRELESLITVRARGRLVRAKSRTGRKQARRLARSGAVD